MTLKNILKNIFGTKNIDIFFDIFHIALLYLNSKKVPDFTLHCSDTEDQCQKSPKNVKKIYSKNTLQNVFQGHLSNLGWEELLKLPTLNYSNDLERHFGRYFWNLFFHIFWTFFTLPFSI
jgi:hypothetical protein